MAQTVKTINDAIQVLVQGVQIGQKAGAYDLKDAAMIQQSLEFLNAQAARNEQPAGPKAVSEEKPVEEKA